jgi:pyruvate formate lyase activating enzyme
VPLDIKGWDPERHRHLTGMDIAPTLAFARRLAARSPPVWLRFVLAPGLSDDPSDVVAVAAFAGSSATSSASTCAVPSDGPL